MKKETFETITRRKRVVSQHEKRRRKKPKNNKSDKFVKIIAPVSIDLYSPKNYDIFCGFISSVKECLLSSKGVYICFRTTKKITAAAGIVLVAEFDKIVGRFGKYKVKATFPVPIRDKFGNEKRTVESILNRIGFFNLIGKTERNISEAADVRCWTHMTGSTADGESAGKILSLVQEMLPANVRKDLYRGSIEALSNCVEHAYIDHDDYCFEDKSKRWWMFASIYYDRLVLIVCDLGVGIPNTIYKTQNESIIKDILDKFGITGSREGELIKVATHVKETRTNMKHRGWGGQDIRSPIRDGRDANLSIFSNRGRYRCSNKRKLTGDVVPMETFYDNRKSIGGTVIEWSVKI